MGTPTSIPFPPQQERSREKLDRILAAAEELLTEKLFEEVGMTEVARRARVSVGTIYTRFPSKEAMLPVLFDRHHEAVSGRIGPLLERVSKERSLKARIELVVGFAVDYHRRHRGLLRALTMYVRANPESIPGRVFCERQGQYRAVAAAVARGDRGIQVSDLEFLLSVVNSVCREQVLFDDVTPLRNSLRSLKRRLTELVHRGLKARTSS